MKTRLVLVKYVASEFDDDSFFKNRKPINKGVASLEGLSFSLENIDCDIDILYSGTDVLSVQTAKKISSEKAIPLTVSEYLDDMFGGDWEDKKWEDISKKFAHEYRLWQDRPCELKLPNGESVDEFKNRLIMKLRDLVNRNSGKSICYVTGDYPINLLLSYFKKLDYTKSSFAKKFEGGSIYYIDIENGNFSVIKER